MALIDTERPATPFLKWPGGKRWLAPRVAALIRPYLKGVYYEPFLGGAAVFFALQPERAVLSDINPDLIGVYRAVREFPEEILERLRRLPVNATTYYNERARCPRSLVDRAVRFLYLNRTAFGGIYRLNKHGEFNVPFGGGERTPEILWRDGLLARASVALRHARISHCDFESVLGRVGHGDVVYCDPTYAVTRSTNGFVRYNDKNFSWEDQARLAEALRAAVRRGATTLLSNAHTGEIKRLFVPETTFVLHRMSAVSPNPSARHEITEYLFLWVGR